MLDARRRIRWGEGDEAAEPTPLSMATFVLHRLEEKLEAKARPLCLGT